MIKVRRTWGTALLTSYVEYLCIGTPSEVEMLYNELLTRRKLGLELEKNAHNVVHSA